MKAPSDVKPGLIIGGDYHPNQEAEVGHFILGVDVGQKADYTALALIEVKTNLEDVGNDQKENIATCDLRAIEVFPLGTTYPKIAEYIIRNFRNIVRDVRNTAASNLINGRHPLIAIDATGIGAGLADLLDEAPDVREHVVRITITSGTNYTSVGPDELHVSKTALVAKLVALIQSHRLLSIPDTPAAQELYEQLANFELKVRGTSEPEFGAFKVGTHDDEVTAFGLAWFLGRLQVKEYIPLIYPIEIRKRDGLEPSFCSAFSASRGTYKTKRWHIGL